MRAGAGGGVEAGREGAGGGVEEGGEMGARRSSLFRRSTLTTRSMRSRMGPEMRLW